MNSVCYGPDRVAECALKRISNFAHEDGWLVLVLHGVDGEGWGSITRNELKQLLNLAESTGALIAPPSSVLFARLRSSYNSCEG